MTRISENKKGVGLVGGRTASAIGSPTRSLGCCAEAAMMAEEQFQWW